MPGRTLMFHAAPSEFRPQIERDGLRAGAPDGGYPDGVYLFTELDNACFFADHMSDLARDNGWDDGMDVWQVDVTGLELTDDPAVTDEDLFQAEYPVRPLRAVYVTGPVPASRLIRLDV